MIRSLRLIRRLFILTLMCELNLISPAIGEPLPVEPLNVLWEELMFEGSPNSIVVEVIGSVTKKSWTSPVTMIEFRLRTPEMASYEPYGISVMKLGEGFWDNGGWVLVGGILGRIGDGDSIVELYGKAIVHRHSYFPFPFHRSRPHDTGYEFILLHRKQGIHSALEVRRWKFNPQEVALNTHPGPPMEDVHAALRYENESRRAILTITGLNRPFEEQVDLSSVTQALPVQETGPATVLKIKPADWPQLATAFHSSASH